MTDHCTEEELLELALSDLDQGQVEGIAAHLAICESCHQRYTAISNSVELVLTAAPSVAPPPGFSGSAMAAMGIHPQPTTSAAKAPDRTWWLVAVAAVLGILAGAAGMGIVQAVDNQPESVQVAAPGAFTTADGEQVGTVANSFYNSEPVLVITVTGGAQDGAYRCQVIMADGTRVDSGYWTLPAGETATWIVEAPAGEPTGMALVAESGQVWATAEL
jgi:hypothetical protein